MSRHLCRSKALPMCCGSRETPVICTPLPSRIHWQLEERWSRCVCFEFNLIIETFSHRTSPNVTSLIGCWIVFFIPKPWWWFKTWRNDQNGEGQKTNLDWIAESHLPSVVNGLGIRVRYHVGRLSKVHLVGGDESNRHLCQSGIVVRLTDWPSTLAVCKTSTYLCASLDVCSNSCSGVCRVPSSRQIRFVVAADGMKPLSDN